MDSCLNDSIKEPISSISNEYKMLFIMFLKIQLPIKRAQTRVIQLRTFYFGFPEARDVIRKEEGNKQKTTDEQV